MPKGIYARPSKNTGIRTEITNDIPRPEAANAKAVEAIRQTDGEDTVSTTERLFGDLTQQKSIEEQILGDEPIAQNPLEDTDKSDTKEPEKVEDETPAQPEPEVKSQEPIQPEMKEFSQDQFLDLEKLGSMKVKAKIDGREETPTFKEVLGQYQLKKHLTEAADRVGEERRKLAEERRQLQELRQQQRMIQPDQNNGQAQDVPHGTIPNDIVFQRIQFLEQQIQQMVEGTKPVLYESNRQRVANELKGQGFNDFLDYIPKMESHILSIKDHQLVEFYDTPMGAKSLYFQLKAQDMNQAPTKQPQQIIQRKPSNQQEIPATRIDSGSQPSDGANDDSAFNYRSAFKRATMVDNDAQRREAWNEVLRQKGIIPD